MKKIITIIGAIVVFGIAFLAIWFQNAKETEKQTERTERVLDLSNEDDWDLINNFMSSIVDWNTDGENLSVMTKDGYELYAEKKSDEYDDIRMYIVKK